MIDQMQQAGLGVPTEEPIPTDFGDIEEPIPTDFGDIEDERRRMGGLVAELLWAFALVGSAFIFLTICGPQ